MEKENYPLDLSYLDEVSGGDINFKKELVTIFLQQVPVFIDNMRKFHCDNDLVALAKEVHTVKSSVLIFGMEKTGAILKEIELLAAKKQIGQIPGLLQRSIDDIERMIPTLQQFVES